MICNRFDRPMQRQEVLIEQQLHFEHRVLNEGGLQLAFPNDDYLPTIFMKNAIVLLIPLTITANLVLPKARIRLRYAVFVTTLMSVPETPVDKYCCPISPHHNVWLPGNRLHIQPIAVSVRPQPLPHFPLGLGAL